MLNKKLPTDRENFAMLLESHMFFSVALSCMSLCPWNEELPPSGSQKGEGLTVALVPPLPDKNRKSREVSLFSRSARSIGPVLELELELAFN